MRAATGMVKSLPRRNRGGCPARDDDAVSRIGKLIGAVGWLLLRHPIGIVIGALFGHLWISALGISQLQPHSFIGPLFGLAARSPSPTAASPNRKLPLPRI